MRDMDNFEDQNLPPELGDVARQLRDNRHEASPIELDQAKQQIIRRASARRTRSRRMMWLRRPAFLLAAIAALSIGGGTAGAFGVHFRLPIISHAAPHAVLHSAPKIAAAGGAAPAVSASSSQYGNPFQQFIQALLTAIGHIFSGGGGGAGGLVAGILAALGALLASLGL